MPLFCYAPERSHLSIKFHFIVRRHCSIHFALFLPEMPRKKKNNNNNRLSALISLVSLLSLKASRIFQLNKKNCLYSSFFFNGCIHMQIDLAATLCLPFIVLLTIHSSVWNVRSFELKKKGGGG